MTDINKYNAEDPPPNRAVHLLKTRTAKRPAAKPDPQPRTTRLQGFGPLTRVSTSFGELPAQALRVRDLVRTRTGQFKPVKWIDQIILDEGYLSHHPRAQPIVIRAGALGRNLPRADVMFAPFQTFSRQQAFVGNPPKCAMEALGRPNVVRQTESMITYTVFHCGELTSVCCEGMWVDIAP